MKLQKLLYYAQAWSLVWDECPLFTEKIEAWANGPVVPDIYRDHRGLFLIESWSTGDAKRLDTEQQLTINSVVNFYGEKTAQWLSDLTHREKPWLDARRGLDPSDRGSEEITLDSMAEYYGSLQSRG